MLVSIQLVSYIDFVSVELVSEVQFKSIAIFDWLISNSIVSILIVKNCCDDLWILMTFVFFFRLN